ncbi:4,5-DOPA dioxygenase extradiol [Gilvimarinus agarilyticus]|nr:4,5-DOPA dioxygenase extradiol [Gilvimarinus agarilyticus]
MNLQSFDSLASGFASTERMPVLFVGHGNPMNAILENETTANWRKMAEGIQPKAILCISAHCQTRGTLVTMAPKPQTIHNFGGFPKELFEVQYPAPGAPEAAHLLIQQVKTHTVEEDHEWGLDHGTWSVLVKMFPKADVPVFQLSLDHHMSPATHYALGEELKALRHKGILIVGSGNSIHNLRQARWNSDQPYDWALAFDSRIKSMIENQDHQSLIHYANLGTEALLSIPTNEHYLPMLYTLALRDAQDQLTFFNETIEMSAIGMRSFVLA